MWNKRTILIKELLQTLFNARKIIPITQLNFSQSEKESESDCDFLYLAKHLIDSHLRYQITQWIKIKNTQIKNIQSSLAPYGRKMFETKDILCVYLDNQIYGQSSI